MNSSAEPDRWQVNSSQRKELALQRFAARQEALLRLTDLAALGFSPAMVDRRVRSGRLWRRYRSVYVVGGRELTQKGEFLAAVFAIGDDSALSVFAAAAHRGFMEWHGGPIDVTVARRVMPREGLRLHCVAEMPPTTIHEGILTTTVEQTIVDLAAVMTWQRGFERAVHEAFVQELTDERSLRAHVSELPPGTPGVERVLAEIADGAKPTRSGLEDAAARLLRRGGFPHFETSAHPPGTPEWVEVDVIFPAQRLILEIDGDRYHNTPFRRKFDRRKQALLEAAGYRVLRLGENDLLPENEERTVARIWAELRELELLELA